MTIFVKKVHFSKNIYVRLTISLSALRNVPSNIPVIGIRAMATKQNDVQWAVRIRVDQADHMD